MLHENISLPHRKHLYQIMANELGISHITVSSIFMLVQIVIVIGYFAFREYDYWYLLGSIIVLCGAYILFMRKYFRTYL